MKILELKTWTTADVILWLIRLYAPRHTKSFWDEVYLPCLRDGDGSLMQQRVGGLVQALEDWFRSAFLRQ